ncbi:MAG: cell division protein ZapA [Hyphomonadaceae bacterium]
MAKAELLIAGKRYALSCAPGQEARLEELGARFDQRVLELTDALGDLGAERLFLAAGLSLLDELDAQAVGFGAKAMDDRIRNLENRAATLLTDAAARIQMLSRRVDEAS